MTGNPQPRKLPFQQNLRSIKNNPQRRQELVTAYLFILPLCIGAALFLILPIVQNIYFSFTNWKGIGDPKWVQFDNYIRMFTSDRKFSYELKNTIAFVCGSIPATMIISILFAALMNQKIRGVAFFRVVYFLPNVTMAAVVAMVWRWLMNSQYGIIDVVLNAMFGIRPAWLSDTSLTMISICIIAVWSNCGYCIVILIAGLQSISDTYYEAAKIDGASPVRMFFSITLPLLTPTIFFLLITRVISAFNQFDLVYMLTDFPGPVQNSLRTLVFGIYESGFVDNKMGYACAKSTVLLFIIIAVTIVQMWGEKHWVNY